LSYFNENDKRSFIYNMQSLLEKHLTRCYFSCNLSLVPKYIDIKLERLKLLLLRNKFFYI